MKVVYRDNNGGFIIRTMETFADRLRSARVALGISQRRLAQLVGRGLTQQAIGKMEDPKERRKGSAHVADLANILQVEALWLATGSGPRIRNGLARTMTENGPEGAETEESMRASLTKIIEGLCVAFTVDAVRAEIQRYEERRAAAARPTEKARA